MKHQPTNLPPEIEAVIEAVLASAALGMTEGRSGVEQELRAHFEDGLDAGTTAEELIRRFGDPERAGREIARTGPQAAARSRGETGSWWMSIVEWKTEVLSAVRRLRRAPGYTMIVVLTLALGVGVNTAIFSVVDAVILKGLPYDEPDRLVRLYEVSEQGWESEFLRGPAVSAWRSWDEIFEEITAFYTYRQVGADLTTGDTPTRVNLLQVSAGYFETLGRAPLVGRTFTEEESYGTGTADESGAPSIAILAHGLWTREFGADPDMLGRVIEMDGEGYEVVGIMPAAFRDPVGPQADVWVPQDMRPGDSNGFGNFYLTGIGRLRDGVDLEAAQERLPTLAAALGEAEPELADSSPRIAPFQADLVGETRRTMLWILAAAAGLVLLTACLNVGNLLFARGMSRDRDLALRAALGSGRTRLVASILVENGLLALVGGTLGLAMGWVGVLALLRAAPDVLPIVTEVRFGTSVFAFALGVSVLALVIFGLAPALRMSRTAPSEVLRAGDRAATMGRVVRRIRDVLVVVQVAAALVIVTGALLLTRSFDSLLDVPLAVDTEGILTYEVHLPTAAYPEPEDRDRFHEELQRRVAGLPGVQATGATSWLPVNGRYHSWGLYYDPENPDLGNDDAWYNTDVRTIRGDYFGAMGVDVLRGQSWDEIDPAEPVVWVNQEVVDAVLGEGDPLDKRIWIAGQDRRIAGVVENVPHTPRGDVSRKTYVPHIQADGRNWALIQVVRSGGDLDQLREAIRAELRSIDPDLVLYRPSPFADVLATVRAQDRFATLLMSAFGLLALTLSLVGTYGVLAGTVASRTREIGIRMALGASAGRVRSLVLGHAARLTLPGLALGMVGAWLASRWLQALLFGVEPGDPVAYAVAVGVFVLVGLLSGWIPARRATRVDTVEVLTAE